MIENGRDTERERGTMIENGRETQRQRERQ